MFSASRAHSVFRRAAAADPMVMRKVKGSFDDVKDAAP